MPFHSARSTPYARQRDFQKRLSNIILANLGHPLPPLLEQTPMALLVDRHRDSFGTAPNRLLTSVLSDQVKLSGHGLATFLPG